MELARRWMRLGGPTLLSGSSVPMLLVSWTARDAIAVGDSVVVPPTALGSAAPSPDSPLAVSSLIAWRKSCASIIAAPLVTALPLPGKPFETLLVAPVER